MEKDKIFSQRKELKQAGHKVVRSHYFLLFIMSLVMILFGVEFQLTLTAWDDFPELASVADEAENADADAAGDVGSGMLERDLPVTASSIWDDILSGNLFRGAKRSEELARQIEEEGDESPSLGRTRGVLAGLVNDVSSGKLAAFLGSIVYSIVHSQAGVAVILILLSALWNLLIFIFLKNLFSAVYRRIFLEARIYETVAFSEMVFFPAVRKWRKAAWAMFVKYFFEALWTLTIIGGIIKGYSYAAVPYIVAENPDVGAIEAINLSRKMMNGHKFELFKLDVTLLGWNLLSFLTVGISDIAYGVAYRTACRTEFYVRVREDAIAGGVDGVERLNDPYLFGKADRIELYENYFDIVDEITVIHEQKIELKGVRKFVADWLGIWVGTLGQKKKYDSQQDREYAIHHYKDCMEGKAYPSRLNPLWRKKGLGKQNPFSFIRNYSIFTLFLLFLSFSCIGWIWEVTLHYLQTGAFANRGTLFGPWLPIYGTGGVIVLMLCSRFRKNPAAEFVAAIVLCGTIEYFTAWYLETTYHQKWWSYDGYFLNLHGRICAEGLLVFGVGCCIIVYIVAPVFDFFISKLKHGVLIGICAVLAVLFGTDAVYSQAHPNMAKGAVEAPAEAESESAAVTETESAAVTETETAAKTAD